MAIQARATAGSTDIGDGAQITIPGTVVVDDLMFVWAGVNNNTFPPEAVAGWDQLLTLTGSGTGSGVGGGTQAAALYSKRATAGDIGATVTVPVSAGGTTKEAANFVAYYADTAGKIAAVSETPAAAILGESVSGTTHVTPTISVAAIGDLIVTGVHKKGGPVTAFTQPAGYTMRGTPTTTAPTNNNGTALADLAAAATGATSGTWTTDFSNLHAATFILTVVEEDPPPPPAMAQPVFRRWNGVSWTLVG